MIKVSIIMPCFNVAKTLFRALDSIIMQDVDFEYEVIVVDDASTDETVELVKKYSLHHPQVKLICNETNKGNAYAYYVGLCASKGEYLCVLDGDDYYTIPDKLQRQVNFLDSDVKEEYVGTATQFIIDLGNDMVNIPERSTIQEFSYADFLTQNSGYYHTATYMYRNIFRENVPSQIGETLYRGDTPRTMFHLLYSGKKIRILDFVGSAYTFEFGGIWSGLKQKQQFEYQISYQMKHKENVTTDFERDAAERLIEFNQNQMDYAQDDLRRYQAMSIDQALKKISVHAGRFAFGQKDFVFQHVYYSSYIDTLCASLGAIDLTRNPENIQKEQCRKNICIVNGILNPYGGGIFSEIKELVDIYHDKNVFLIVTEMMEIPEETRNILSIYSNLTILCPPADCEKRLQWFRKQFVQISPYRTYYYCSHKDVYGAALAQKGCCENITLFSFDHGYLCGISNSNLDTIIAKRPTDYWMLEKTFKKKVLFIPTWNNGAYGCEGRAYQPFYEHNALITASGAARYYKIDGRPPYRYIDMVVSLLKATGGKHYHFGEIPDNIRAEIKDKLKAAGITPEHFVHIPWSDNLPLELLNNHVDIFIEPFPVVSYKLTLEVLSIGVPVIAKQGMTRMNIADFLPQDSMIWHNEKEFISILSALTKEFLLQESKRAQIYFNTYHNVKKVSELLRKNISLSPPKKNSYPDNTLMDITFSLRLFGNSYRISIKDEEKKRAEIVTFKEQQAKQKQLCCEIENIRASRAFKLGFAITLPMRFCKQLLCYSIKYGPIQGVMKLKNAHIMFYHRECKEEELYTLKNSSAYKLGVALAKPYYRIKFGPQHDRMLRIEKYLEEQRKNMVNEKVREEKRSKELEHLIQTLNLENQKRLSSILEKISDKEEGIEKAVCATRAEMKEINTIINRNFTETSNSINTNTKKIMVGMASKIIQRNTIEHLDYHLTEHCNLNCASCSTYAPIAAPAYADLESFEQDIRKLYALVGDAVQQIHLLGGEPLLHPKAGEFAKSCRSVFQKSRIDFTTNGLLISDMPESFWQILRENDIAIKYTQYPVNFDYNKMINYIREKGVYVFSASGKDAIKYFRRIPLNTKGTFNMYNSFIQCPYTDCVQLRAGKLYHCPASAFSDLLNRKIKETDSLAGQFKLSQRDYISLDEAKTSDEVFEFLSNAIPFCQYCDMNHINEHINWCVSQRNIREWVDL
ncbi:MAG: glycosyltransferase [Lachnospiraceae bacterium]|nr:glycosyltransferase [Lachnospiraceae bacterium]